MRLIALLVLIFVALSLALPALAGPQCGPRDGVIAALTRQFGEMVAVQGMTADGRMMEIWSNPETGSWTATMTTAGMTCMVAAGNRFQATKPGEPA